jgi:ketosteroid isomerase-like protein
MLVALGTLATAATLLVAADTGREDQIREANAAFEDAYAAGDVERLMECYADDAVSMPPGYPASVGKAAIKDDFEMFFEVFTVEERDLEIVDIWISGDLAARRAEWSQTLNDGSGSFTEFGKCVVGFKKIRNEWKVIWEIWNNHPEP